MAKRFLSTINFFRGDSDSENCILYTYSENGVKKVGKVSEPKITFYVDKEGVDRVGREMLVPRSEVDSITCAYKDLARVMADLSGNTDGLRTAFKTNSAKNFIRQMNQLPLFHGSDIDISDHYIDKLNTLWSKKGILDETPKLHKCYSDIEIDLYHQSSNFNLDTDDTAPVDLASVYDERTKIIHVFALDGPDNSDNEQIKDFRKNWKQHKVSLLSVQKNLVDIDLRWFENDLDLIVAYFDKINEIKPDFIMFWKIMFDIPYLYRRLQRLEVSPEDVMCPLEKKYIEIYEDKSGNNDISKRGDYVNIAGYTNYIDQMMVYASFRATKKKPENYKLDTIGKIETGEGKVELPIPIRNVSRHDYKTYFFYHIQDVLLEYKIEQKTKDIDLLYLISTISRTRIVKAWRKTISLRNLAAKYMEDGGEYVISNNHNINNETSKKFPGAFVHDVNNNQNEGIKLFGKRSNRIFDNVEDVDMGSLYPSIIISHMIDPKNQIGRFTLTKSALIKQCKEVFNNISEEGLLTDNELGYRLSDALVDRCWMRVLKWLGGRNQDDIIEELL